MAVLRESDVINSIIGRGTKFRGDFELNGLLRIDGAFEGTIESEGKVLVGENGSARARVIRARSVSIGGEVIGDIFATEKVTILSTGKVTGDIETPHLIAEEGVFLNGKVTVLSDKHIPTVHSDAEEIAEARKELGMPVVGH